VVERDHRDEPRQARIFCMQTRAVKRSFVIHTYDVAVRKRLDGGTFCIQNPIGSDG
jgi:hypothetical protein